jgi:hypothetical protein
MEHVKEHSHSDGNFKKGAGQQPKAKIIQKTAIRAGLF